MTDKDAPLPGALLDDAMSSSPTTKDPVPADPVAQAKEADHSDYFTFNNGTKGDGRFSSVVSDTASTTTTNKEEDLATQAFRFLATATPGHSAGLLSVSAQSHTSY